jgi:hypothetical protein
MLNVPSQHPRELGLFVHPGVTLVVFVEVRRTWLSFAVGRTEARLSPKTKQLDKKVFNIVKDKKYAVLYVVGDNERIGFSAKTKRTEDAGNGCWTLEHLTG